MIEFLQQTQNTVISQSHTINSSGLLLCRQDKVEVLILKTGGITSETWNKYGQITGEIRYRQLGYFTRFFMTPRKAWKQRELPLLLSCARKNGPSALNPPEKPPFAGLSRLANHLPSFAAHCLARRRIAWLFDPLAILPIVSRRAVSSLASISLHMLSNIPSIRGAALAKS